MCLKWSEALRVHTDSYPIMWWNFSFNNDVIVHISFWMCIASHRIGFLPNESDFFVLCLSECCAWRSNNFLFPFNETLRTKEKANVLYMLRFFSIHLTNTHINSYGDDLRRCLSTTRHLKTTTNGKWQALIHDVSHYRWCVYVSVSMCSRV